jgi:hypothetical protein
MPKTYVVKQGDHLAAIANQNGFGDYRTIWDHPLNADLKELRQNPNVLFPGDQVQIPDSQPHEESRPTGKQHIFNTTAKAIRLRIKAEDLYEQPVANTACELKINGRTIPLTSDGDGLIDQVVAPVVNTAKLIFHQADSTLDELDVTLYVGHLDPVDQPTGQRARLNNLGYFAGALDEDDEDTKLLASAVEEFQCDHQIPVTGSCDAQTQAKLKEVHGC